MIGEQERPTSEGDAIAQVSRIPFGRARISFTGWGAKEVAHFLSNVAFHDGEPGILRIADAIAMPRVPCIYDADGMRIPETTQCYVGPEGAQSASLSAKLTAIEANTGPPRVDPPRGMPVVTGPVLFLGKLTQHYGHVLADLLSRVWALGHFDPNIRLLFLPAKDPFRDAVVGSVLETLGIAPDRVVRFREPTRFADLICPLAAVRWSERIYSVFDRPHRAIGRRLAEQAKPVAKPVYLSRRGLGGGYRAIHNEEQLEAALAREGFEIVRPETLSLAEQAAIFRGDAPVVGVMGSALHSLLFRDIRRPKVTAVLTDRDVHGRFLLFDAVKGASSHYLSCLDTPDVAMTRIQERTLIIDVPRALEMLDGVGLFKGRRPVSGKPRPARPSPLLNVRADLQPAAKVVALDKDNVLEPGAVGLQPGDWVQLQCPSDARWLAIVDERQEDRSRLYAVRDLEDDHTIDASHGSVASTRAPAAVSTAPASGSVSGV